MENINPFTLSQRKNKKKRRTNQQNSQTYIKQPLDIPKPKVNLNTTNLPNKPKPDRKRIRNLQQKPKPKTSQGNKQKQKEKSQLKTQKITSFLNKKVNQPMSKPKYKRIPTTPRHVLKSKDNNWDYWDKSHLLLPCSKYNTWIKLIGNRNSKPLQKWYLINTTLKCKLDNCQKFLKALQRINNVLSTNSLKPVKSFFENSLTENEQENFFTNVLPKIQNLVLSLPHEMDRLNRPIKLLRSGRLAKEELPQSLIASLMACSFFCVMPYGDYQNTRSPYLNRRNFTQLYIGKHQMSYSNCNKMKCFINYFQIVTKNDRRANGMVSFYRNRLVDIPKWETSESKLSNLIINKHLRIEDCHKHLQVDFANKFIGGGVLSNGCVQEEIRFAICPELVVSCMIIEKMKKNETVLIIGAKRYSNYTSYGSDFTFNGAYNPEDEGGDPKDVLGEGEEGESNGKEIGKEDEKEKEKEKEKENENENENGNGNGNEYKLEKEEEKEKEKNKRTEERIENQDLNSLTKTHLIAIDAVNFSRKKPYAQYRPFYIKREINKIYCGFQKLKILNFDNRPIASGNFGCGVFQGDKELKSLLQLLAASEAKRELVYCSFEDEKFSEKFSNLYKQLLDYGYTVSKLYNFLLDFNNQTNTFSVFEYIENQILEEFFNEVFENDNETFDGNNNATINNNNIINTQEKIENETHFKIGNSIKTETSINTETETENENENQNDNDIVKEKVMENSENLNENGKNNIEKEEMQHNTNLQHKITEIEN
ncbi:poly adp-ribose glycohydrolase [Anaeramoeba flamelloides]|uniref:poly(ADP-ribose) glycohydrolase n=1 Tax=Anaeramoeba flamelloides TaxID=1746091 RepID=A0ABQ8Y828_9EUKA|nr:poly adp-ribose glycohydrolase [Anaeramoeba flamelloides]